MTTADLDNIQEMIKEDIDQNPIILFMKGSKDMPQCGFSAKVVQILNALNSDYVTRDVLMDASLRQGIKDFSDWPTVPQLYVKGEFIGGCDIVTELFENGELADIVA